MRRRTTTIATTVAAVALVLGACGDGIDERAADRPPTIRLGASPAASGGAETSSRMMSADSDAYAYGPVVFVPDAKLAGLDGPAASWRFVGGDPDPERIAALAEALGVEGDVVERPADQGGGWIVGPDDGTAASLSVSAGAMADWWYNPGPGAAGMAATSCAYVGDGAEGSKGGASEPAAEGDDTAVASDPDAPDAPTTPADIDVDPCPEPEPPTGVPSDDEALERGRELLDELGVDLDAVELEVQGDEWGRTVLAWPLLDGMRAPLSSSVGFGGEGVVSYANGFLGELEQGPDYPRAGTAAGVERLNAPWGGGDPLIATSRAAVATDAGDGGATSPDAAEAPAAVTRTVTGVEPSLWMVWNAPDDVWLVPAYTFTTDDGSEHSVVAVTDEYLDVTEPDVATDPAATVGGGTEPAPGPAATTGAIDLAAALVGLPEAEAARLAEEQGWAFRVVERDGESLAVTDDLRVDRINATIAAGTVTAATIG